MVALIKFGNSFPSCFRKNQSSTTLTCARAPNFPDQERHVPVSMGDTWSHPIDAVRGEGWEWGEMPFSAGDVEQYTQ